MIEDLVKNLKSSNEELEMHCANAIFKVKFTVIWNFGSNRPKFNLKCLISALKIKKQEIWLENMVD